VRALPAHTPQCAVPVPFLRRFGMVPVHLSSANSVLHVAFAECIDYPAVLAIEKMLSIKTEVCLTTRSELNAALERLEERNSQGGKFFEHIGDTKDIVRILSSYTAQLSANELRIVTCREMCWASILGDRETTDLLFVRSEPIPCRSGDCRSVTTLA
jgi:hypothetical protein